jgi:shikimate dehydrogenase
MTQSPPKLAGVMGWPVKHSLSPVLHGHWIAERRLSARYMALPIAPEALASALQALPKLGFRGVNLTIPYKESAIPHLHAIDAAAQRIGAVNTVIVQGDGTLLGRNTDAEGYANSLLEAGVDVAGGHGIVLGAGGAARAVVFALQSLKTARITIANRSLARAEALAADLSSSGAAAIDVVAWNMAMDKAGDARLLVNTTSLGMSGQPPLEIDLAALPAWAAVSDIVYRPLTTPLLAAAQRRRLKTVDGLGMLLHQAAPAFEAWFGVRPGVTAELRQKLIAAMGL